MYRRTSEQLVFIVPCHGKIKQSAASPPKVAWSSFPGGVVRTHIVSQERNWPKQARSAVVGETGIGVMKKVVDCGSG